MMQDIIEKAILNNYTYFISGMALGVDMICSEIVLNLKKKYKNIYLECAIPCLNQEKEWAHFDQRRYKKILKKADFIYVVNNSPYSTKCMHERNKYMVTKSNVVIAVWNGLPSGTSYTINLAKQQNKKVKIISLDIFK